MKSKSSVVRFFSFLKPHGGLLSLAVFSGILRYLIPLCVPWGIKIIIDDILTRPASGETFRALHQIAGGLFALYLLWTILSFLRLYATGQVGNHVIFDLRFRLFQHLQKMSLEFFERKKIGAIVSRMLHDINAAESFVGYGIIATMMDLSSIAVISLIMFAIHWQLACVALAMIPFYVIASRYFSKKIRKQSTEVHQHIEDLSGHLHEKFSGIALVQSFAREEEEQNAFQERAQLHLFATLANTKWQAVGLSVTGFITAAAPLFVVWYGAGMVLNGLISVGELVAFYAYISLLYMPVARLTELQVVIAKALAAIDRIFSLLDQHPEVREAPHPVPLRRSHGRVEFQNVTFEYEPGQPVLQGLSLTLEPGETVALVGPSGCGKSTVAKLLLRFYDVQTGSVRIDGTDIRDLRLSDLRQAIAVVSQEPILFSGTLYENIRYGKIHASHDEILQAAGQAHAHEFIMALPKKYGTPVGEKGIKLSAGERQRIAIARAFLKDAPVLILDEPTSALDGESEKLVTDSLKKLRENRTTLLISHRQAPLQNVHRIVRLDPVLVSAYG